MSDFLAFSQHNLYEHFSNSYQHELSNVLPTKFHVQVTQIMGRALRHQLCLKWLFCKNGFTNNLHLILISSINISMFKNQFINGFVFKCEQDYLRIKFAMSISSEMLQWTEFKWEQKGVLFWRFSFYNAITYICTHI